MRTAPIVVGVDSHASRDVASAGRCEGLTAFERAEMFDLLAAHFDGVTARQFARDLDEKNWVLRIRRAGRLVGFSTLQVLEAAYQGRHVHVVYSGDTIVVPEAWGSPILARAWIALVREIQTSAPGAPWYWLLLSSGFRTYRFLPVFWQQFWPRHDAPTPPAEQGLLGALARLRFGDQFDEAAGIVRFRQPQRLRASLALVPDQRVTDPHVAFFLSHNPGHAEGDELVCLTDLEETNLTSAGRRMVRSGAPRAVRASS